MQTGDSDSESEYEEESMGNVSSFLGSEEENPSDSNMSSKKKESTRKNKPNKAKEGQRSRINL